MFKGQIELLKDIPRFQYEALLPEDGDMGTRYWVCPYGLHDYRLYSNSNYNGGYWSATQEEMRKYFNEGFIKVITVDKTTQAK